MAKKDATEAVESIDLALRFKNDGGPVFEFLSSLTNSHMRGERVRQLLYLGLMRESELRRPATGIVQAAPSPDPAPAVGKTKGKAVAEVQPQPEEKGSQSTEAINAADLEEIFG